MHCIDFKKISKRFQSYACFTEAGCFVLNLKIVAVVCFCHSCVSMAWYWSQIFQPFMGLCVNVRPSASPKNQVSNPPNVHPSLISSSFLPKIIMKIHTKPLGLDTTCSYLVDSFFRSCFLILKHCFWHSPFLCMHLSTSIVASILEVKFC